MRAGASKTRFPVLFVASVINHEKTWENRKPFHGKTWENRKPTVGTLEANTFRKIWIAENLKKS